LTSDLVEPREEVIDVAKLVVDHKGEHTHLGGTSLVELLGAEVFLGILVRRTDPADRESRGREVSRERSLSLLPASKLKDTAEGKDLEGTSNRDIEGSIPARSKVGELGSIGGNFTREVDSGFVDQISNNTKLADTSVLDLNATETVELVLVSIGDKSKRIEEAKRRLGTELVLEGLEGGSLGGRLGRGKGGSRGNKGGGNGELHLDFFTK
jgi:hypothetical protein